MHLYFARFINHFLHDIGAVKHEEPFKRIITKGHLLAETFICSKTGKYLSKSEAESFPDQTVMKWEKMSKSKLNGISPVQLVEKYGEDYARMYMTLGSENQSSASNWDNKLFKVVDSILNNLLANLTRLELLKSANSDATYDENKSIKMLQVGFNIQSNLDYLPQLGKSKFWRITWVGR